MTQTARIEDLERALRKAENMLSGIFREIELPGEWDGGVSALIDELRETLAREPGPGEAATLK